MNSFRHTLALRITVFTISGLLLSGCMKNPPNEVQIGFAADRTSLLSGECATLEWNIQGGSGYALNGQLIQNTGQTIVCPEGTTTYLISAEDGENLFQREIVIVVTQDEQHPPFETDATASLTPETTNVTVLHNLEYGQYGYHGQTHALLLDLYLPEIEAGSQLPVLVYIHGGGWMEGSKDTCPGNTLAKYGYAVACIDYRLATIEGNCPAELTFPAQIQDVKSAVRWLRSQADLYGFDGDHFGALGDSSGGHLASLLGTSYGVSNLSGTLNPDPSDAVQAVADWYGPVDVTQPPPAIVFTEDPCGLDWYTLNTEYGGESTPFFYWTLAWSSFLGGSLSDPGVLEQAHRATPLAYIDPSDPPFLIIHGESDGMVPIQQSQLLADGLQNAGVMVTFIQTNGGHSYAGIGQEIATEFLEPTLYFFNTHLKPNP